MKNPRKAASLLVAAIALAGLIFPVSLCGGSPAPAAPETSGPPAPRDALPELGRAAERPDHEGPLNITGYRYEHFKGSTKSYYIEYKFYYPALTAGENTTADTSAGPYKTLFMLPPMMGPDITYDFIAPRIVSWGFVVIGIAPNWDDVQNSLNVTDMNELMDILEQENITPSHILYGMMEKGCYGIFGYSSGGGRAVINGGLIPRIKAVSTFAAAVGTGTIDALAPYYHIPIQLQIGVNDTMYRAGSDRAYAVFAPPKYLLETHDGNHGGPFFWDPVISFFQYYMKNLTDYGTFLHGFEAMDDMGNLNYSLHFTLPDGTFFPGNISLSGGPTSLNESESASFSLSYTGWLPLYYPGAAFEWDFDADGVVDHRDPLNTSATYDYPRSGSFKTGAWFAIGRNRVNINNSLYVSVTNKKPSVSLAANFSTTEDQPLSLGATVNDTPNDLSTLQLSWDYGDGVTEPFASCLTASHTYLRSGNFVLKVTVRDDDGSMATAQGSVKVLNIAPTCSVGPDLTALKDEEVPFTGVANDTPSDIQGLEFKWDFGDGSSSEWGPGMDGLHVYTGSGNFTATFNVRDGDGATASCNLTVHIVNTPPEVTILAPAWNASLVKDTVVGFDGSGTDTVSDNGSLRYRWDFGDGNSSEWAESARAEHIYTKGGRFTVSLFVRDRDGDEDRSSMVLSVANQRPTARLLLPVITDAEEDDKVQFSASGDDTESDRDRLNFTWDIAGRSYYGASFSLAFTSAGQKKFTLIVIDPEGARDTVNGTILIRNPAPWVTGSVYPDRFYVNGSLNYTAGAGDTVSDALTLFVLWEFGDNTTSMELNGTHAYSAPGSYLVRLTVMDDEGAKAERSFTVQVLPQVAPPKPPKPANPGGSINWVYPSLAVLGAVLLIVALAITKFAGKSRASERGRTGGANFGTTPPASTGGEVSFRMKKSAPPPRSPEEKESPKTGAPSKADEPPKTGAPSKADEPPKTDAPSTTVTPSKTGKSESSKEGKPPTDSSEE